MPREKNLNLSQMKLWIESKLIESPCQDLDSPCLIWTGLTRDKRYGIISYKRRIYYIHRFYCWLSNPDFDLMDKTIFICHNCNNRLCCRHIYKGSPKSNTRDCINNGNFVFRFKTGEHPDARFTLEQIREMRRLWESGITQMEIARRFGTLANHVCRIVHRKRWNID